MATKAVTNDNQPPAVTVDQGPVRKINPQQLAQLGQNFSQTFTRYASDRRLAELKWLRNLRQYLGIYDPDIDRNLPANRSRAYPRLTRVKCISMLSRVMNLMFPGDERNWSLEASPNADMDPSDVAQAVQDLLTQRQQQGLSTQLTPDLIQSAVQALAEKRADQLSRLIDDQLEEIGGDQSLDYVAINRKILDSGIKFGVGVLEGPFVRTVEQTGWVAQGQVQPGMPQPQGGQQALGMQFTPVKRTIYKPTYEVVPVWDFYPDMSARTLPGGGYFLRKVMSRSQVRKLADRVDFFGDQVRAYLKQDTSGNYRPREFENDLRVMGTQANVNSIRQDPQGKYEIIVWKGPISAIKLAECGVDVPAANMADDVDAELWMIGTTVIKAAINPWKSLGVDVKTIHTFMFDEDDTSPLGNGLPNNMRDSALSVAATARMALDNASVVCGPNLEVNMDLLRPDQDVSQMEAYKVWRREGLGADAQFPAVRELAVQSHIPDLEALMKVFMDFADMETFVGPATGGDMSHMPSEPMRTAAGASMVRGDAALPFKDVVRNFDTFTQSVIQSLVQFNRKLNPEQTPQADFNVVARGATSLIAKEVRGSQIDMLAQTLAPEDWDHVDRRKLVEARFASRDLTSLLVSPEEASQRREGREQSQAQQQQQQQQMLEAQLREILSQAYKNITQGQKNTAAAGATTANAALDILTAGMEGHNDGSGSTSQGGDAGKPAQQEPGTGGPGLAGLLGGPAGGGQG